MIIKYSKRSSACRSNSAQRVARWTVLLLTLACLSGCAAGVPGETYSAGYIFPERQSQVSHDFVVRNNTSKHVKILKVEKTCTCTSYELGKYELAPGEMTTLSNETVRAPGGTADREMNYSKSSCGYLCYSSFDMETDTCLNYVRTTSDESDRCQ